jgi:hypothetical protein
MRLRYSRNGETRISQTQLLGVLNMNGYIALYRGKQIEVYANTSYEAQQKASIQFKAKKSYEVSVYLCELQGKQVVTHLD